MDRLGSSPKSRLVTDLPSPPNLTAFDKAQYEFLPLPYWRLYIAHPLSYRSRRFGLSPNDGFILFK